jgi:prepilin-type N-terminal cleavage/methylation domain-containing protein
MQKHANSLINQRERGFSLIEIAVVIAVVGLLIASLAGPLSSQIDNRRLGDTRSVMKLAEEAILVFAATNGRVPCPASSTSNGIEVPRDPAGRCILAGGAVNGVVLGFVPARTLGLSPLDNEGFITDAWGTAPANRIGYAVVDAVGAGTAATGDFSATRVMALNGVFTKTGGLNETYALADGTNVPKWMAISNYVNLNYNLAYPGKGLLHVCRSATGVAGLPASPRCGAPTNGTQTPSNNTLTDQAPVVLFSLGPTNNTPPYVLTRTDEAANLPNAASTDKLFVSHEKSESGAAGGAFDDVVTWISLNILYARMIDSGRLAPFVP